jgi:hypothetical protein
VPIDDVDDAYTAVATPEAHDAPRTADGGRRLVGCRDPAPWRWRREG